VNKPSIMTYGIRDLRKEFKVLRGFIFPCLYLATVGCFIESRVQLNGIELGGIISQFVLRASGVESLEVLLVPFGAANKYLKRFTAPFQYFGGIRMIRRKLEINFFRMFYLAEFHG